jgi:major membrane immunogen (membrane-anchored lipoprotein)
MHQPYKENFVKTKRALFILILSSLFLFTACQENDIINDPETGEILVSESSDLQDGEYRAATSHYDERGYGQVLTLSIRNGIITVVDFQEINLNGQNRLQLEGSETSWDKIAPLNLDSLYFKLYSDLLLNQRSSKVSAISGATQTSRIFILLAQSAINQSLSGNHELVTLDTTITYIINSQADADHFQGVMTATFSGDTLTSLNYDELNSDTGETRSQSESLNQTIDYTALFRSYTDTTLENQSLNSIFSTENLNETEKKYLDCLNQLQLIRVNFIAP